MGSTKPRAIPLRCGVYCPTLTFFNPKTDEIDTEVTARHAVRLARAGLAGLVTMGSNGEAVHLDRAEKSLITRTTREALDAAGYTQVPVIAGASEQSIQGSITLCREAAEAGASYALILSPSYFRAAMDNAALEDFFVGVADESPIPIILYNYPGAVAGIDMDSDFLIKLAQHPNIVGTKFTCGNIGKLTRVAHATEAATTGPPKGEEKAKRNGQPYMAFGGFADFTLQTAVSGGSGVIAGFANVMPRICVEVWRLWNVGELESAIKMQKSLSEADWVLTKGAVPGTKAALQELYEYGGYARRPLRQITGREATELVRKLEDAWDVEECLPDVGKPETRTE